MIFSELKGSAVTELVTAWLKTKGSLTCGRWVWQPHGHSRSGDGGLHHHLQPPWTRLFRRSHSWGGWGASLLHLVDSKTQFSQVLFVLSVKARAGFAVPASLGSTELPPSHATSKCAHKKRWRRHWPPGWIILASREKPETQSPKNNFPASYAFQINLRMTPKGQGKKCKQRGRSQRLSLLDWHRHTATEIMS